MNRDRDKELDDLFREGLQNPPRTANFREDDWDVMEALLEKDKKRGILYYLPVVSGIAATLVLGLAWFLISTHDKPTIVKNNSSKQPVNTIGTGKNIDTVTDHMASVNAQRNAIGPNKIIDTVTDRIAAVNALKAVKRDVVSGQNNTADNHSQRTLQNNNGNVAYAAISTSKNTREVNKGISSTNNGTHKTDENILAVNNTEVLAANISPIDLSGLNTSNALYARFPDNNKSEIVSAKAANKVVKQSYSKRPQLAITVLASPDINGVSSFNNSMVGTNAGLLFTVGITKKLTVSTGALYSKKPYLTSFADYHSSSGYKFKSDPTSVTADCRVLDIPINIDYQVYKKARNTFSLGTGISSYIMLRENYHYNYDYVGATGPTDYDIANKNKHILGVLNLEATYQHQLNSKFSIGVQPYMKVPLTNIGYSQVKLQSAGLAVGVTWNINSANK